MPHSLESWSPGPPALCLDFANTNGPGRKGGSPDGLAGFDDLVRWLESNGAVDKSALVEMRRMRRRQGSEADRLLARAKRLREAVYRVMSAAAHRIASNDTDLAIISKEATAAMRRLRIEVSEGAFGWALDDSEPGSALAAVSLSAAALLTGPDLNRVRECSNATCGWLFIDQSKNRSRKWCDMSACGNMMKARRHYARVRAAKRRTS